MRNKFVPSVGLKLFILAILAMHSHHGFSQLRIQALPLNTAIPKVSLRDSNFPFPEFLPAQFKYSTRFSPTDQFFTNDHHYSGFANFISRISVAQVTTMRKLAINNIAGEMFHHYPRKGNVEFVMAGPLLLGRKWLLGK